MPYRPTDLHAELDRQHAGHGACCAKCAAKKRARLRALSTMPADNPGHGRLVMRARLPKRGKECVPNPDPTQCFMDDECRLWCPPRSKEKRTQDYYPPPGQFPPPLEPGITKHGQAYPGSEGTFNGTARETGRGRETGRRRLQVPRPSKPPPGTGPDTTPEMHGRSKASGLLARVLGGRRHKMVPLKGKCADGTWCPTKFCHCDCNHDLSACRRIWYR